MYHFIYLFTLCMYVCVSTLKDDGWGSVLSFRHAGSEDQTARVCHKLRPEFDAEVFILNNFFNCRDRVCTLSFHLQFCKFSQTLQCEHNALLRLDVLCEEKYIWVLDVILPRKLIPRFYISSSWQEMSDCVIFKVSYLQTTVVF